MLAADCKVLIVDDSAHIRILITKLLRNLQFKTIETAEDGKQGLEKVRSFQPHVIFLDGIMPEMDGLGVLREVKKSFPEIFVIITSSLSEREKVLQFKESGADAYLLKPFEHAKFEEVVQKALSILESRQKG